MKIEQNNCDFYVDGFFEGMKKCINKHYVINKTK